MADPRNELADIVAPAAPDILAAGGGSQAGWVAAGLVALAACALLAWGWHRRRPARVLRAIAAAAAQRQGSLPTLAARLDAWTRTRFRLARVDAARCPPGLDPIAWSDWVKALEQLRFAPPRPEGHAELANLCERVRAWRRHA